MNTALYLGPFIMAILAAIILNRHMIMRHTAAGQKTGKPEDDRKYNGIDPAETRSCIDTLSLIMLQVFNAAVSYALSYGLAALVRGRPTGSSGSTDGFAGGLFATTHYEYEGLAEILLCVMPLVFCWLASRRTTQEFVLEGSAYVSGFLILFAFSPFYLFSLIFFFS